MSSHSWLWSLPTALTAVFAAVFIGALATLGSLSRAGRERDLAGRIEQYGPRRKVTPAADDAAGKKNLNQVAVDVTTGLMSPTTQRRLTERLDLAAVRRTPAEWTLLGCLVAVVIAAALSLATGYVVVGILGGPVLAWLIMRLSLSYLIRRRRAAFSDQLPDLLQLMGTALQSGFSLQQALDAAARENAQPAAGEFARALTETKLGAELDDCLDTIATRMGSADLRWTVMAIRIQRGIGGNLAEILATIVGTMRERGFLRRQVRALSAEGRLSAYVLVALPIAVGTWLFMTDRPYMRLLYTTTLGLIMLGIAVALLVIGAVWMFKTIQVEV